ncbi:SDR family oxidoreductase [Cumulibacter soli]|uniref:SDR family oxidoreductase n=1 Tax=Cumulibacter soli TaxID=2546344 RepID=UPI0010683F27|nr:SDR family oxidoreductase [Cumulibacter soli]
MDVKDKVAIVTGAGSGIGAALTRKLVASGARVTAVDLDEAGVAATIADLGDKADRVSGRTADVSNSEAIAELIEHTRTTFGPVDLYFANAGIIGPRDLGDSDEDWLRTIDVNTLAHVRAARLLVPEWLERGSGYFIATASAAGLLSQIGAAAYSTTKAAAVGFADWMSITYGDRGIGVSCLCPQGVNTAMLNQDSESGSVGARVVTGAGAVLEPDDVADIVLKAVNDEQFLILPHPEVGEYMARKANDRERWLRGMRRLQAKASGN